MLMPSNQITGPSICQAAVLTIYSFKSDKNILKKNHQGNAVEGFVYLCDPQGCVVVVNSPGRVL